MTAGVHEQLQVCSCQHLNGASQGVRALTAKSCLGITNGVSEAGGTSQQAAGMLRGAAPASSHLLSPRTSLQPGPVLKRTFQL